jgi:hypothetical protein
MPSLDAEPVSWDDVVVLQAGFELPYSCRQAVLPAGLHPTTPPMLVVLAWQVPDSPWGPFGLAQARVSCRSGVRPRGFVAGCIVDNPAAAAALAAGWGLPTTPGAVQVDRGYDRVELVVKRDDRVVTHLIGSDPDPLSAADVQFSVSTTLARTPRGLRLVQVEPDYDLRRVERVRPSLVAFDAEGWNQPLLAPGYPVSATISLGRVAIPALRFLSLPDVLAFEGTEKL